MRIGIGLPNPVPGTPGPILVEWARRAEEHGFSSLATIDRIVYPSHESLTTLAAAGAATERIGLMTKILIGPTRNPVGLAKQAASIDQISEGRFTLGLAAGSRSDDYAAVGRPFTRRGRDFDELLEVIHRVWRGEPVSESGNPVGPPPYNGERVRVLIGGTVDVAVDRTVKWAEGWTAGGGRPAMVGPMVERVRTAWAEAGRAGEPYLVALTYFGLGDRESESSAYIRDYYAYLGDWAGAIDSGVVRTPEAASQSLAAFGDLGLDELIFVPTVAETAQVDLIADAVL